MKTGAARAPPLADGRITHDNNVGKFGTDYQAVYTDELLSDRDYLRGHRDGQSEAQQDAFYLAHPEYMNHAGLEHGYQVECGARTSYSDALFLFDEYRKGLGIGRARAIDDRDHEERQEAQWQQEHAQWKAEQAQRQQPQS